MGANTGLALAIGVGGSACVITAALVSRFAVDVFDIASEVKKLKRLENELTTIKIQLAKKELRQA